MHYESWAWVPLIGFERDDADRGVGRYLDALGFTPTGLSLFMFSPDVALLHQDTDEEIVLPADYCSYYGTPVNEERGVQPWTNHDVRALVRHFHARGVKVCAGLMGVYTRDAHHQEWLTQHPDALDRRRTDWDASLALLKRLQDGTRVQDVFAAKVAQMLPYYDFDGLHAADFLSPPASPLWESDWSDDMIDQFMQATGIALPDEVAAPSDETPAGMLEHTWWIYPERRPAEGIARWGNYAARVHRADWIWRHLRRAWMDFYVDRWADCWKTIADAAHRIGKQVFLNNAWTHDPVEAIYRFGIDYRRLEEAGVDGIVAETVSPGMTLLGRRDREWHHAYQTMFLLMGMYAPAKKRLFLHSTRDATEQWDAIRHAPMHVERDIVSLPNVYAITPEGALKRCADGFLICLGDGMTHAEWAWLRERWALGFDEIPRRILAPTLIWSAHAVSREVDALIARRRCPTQQLVTDLLLQGAGVAACADIAHLHRVRGPLLLVNADLFSPEELARVFAYAGGPVMLIGLPLEEAPSPAMAFRDVQEPDALSCTVYGYAADPAYTPPAITDEHLPADLLAVPEPLHFYQNLACRRVSTDFLAACARVSAGMSGMPVICGETPGAALQAMELADGRVRLLVKSHRPHYLTPMIDMRRPIAAATIRSKFPVAQLAPNGSRFKVRVPPDGVTVVDIELAE